MFMCFCLCFFCNVTATNETYSYLHTLSLHAALPRAPRGELTHLIEGADPGCITNLTLGPAASGGQALYLTEARGGTVLAVPWPIPASQHKTGDRKSTRLNSSP